MVGFIGAGNYASRVLIPAFKDAGAVLRTVASNGGVSGVYAGKKYGFQQTTTDTASLFTDPQLRQVTARPLLKALSVVVQLFWAGWLCLSLTKTARAKLIQILQGADCTRFNRCFLRMRPNICLEKIPGRLWQEN